MAARAGCPLWCPCPVLRHRGCGGFLRSPPRSTVPHGPACGQPPLPSLAGFTSGTLISPLMLKDLIARDRDGFKRLCETHEVASLHAFGSSVRDTFGSESDVDLVVDLKTRDPLRFGELMLDLWDKLETFFGRKVDLLTLRSVKNPVMRSEIERTKVLVYDGTQAQVLD